MTRTFPQTKKDNFWTFTAGSLIVLFILYVVKTGPGGLKAWADILLYNPATATQVGQSGDNSAKGGSADASKPVNVGGLSGLTGGLAGSPGTQIVPPGTTVFGEIFRNIQKFFGGGK